MFIGEKAALKIEKYEEQGKIVVLKKKKCRKCDIDIEGNNIVFQPKETGKVYIGSICAQCERERVRNTYNSKKIDKVESKIPEKFLVRGKLNYEYNSFATSCVTEMI